MLENSQAVCTVTFTNHCTEVIRLRVAYLCIGQEIPPTSLNPITVKGSGQKNAYAVVISIRKKDKKIKCIEERSISLHLHQLAS